MKRIFSSIFMACLPVALSLSVPVQAQMVPEGGGMKSELADKGFNFRLYGKFRPKVTFNDDGDDSTTDIRDDSSRVGIQGKIPISSDLHGVLRGEWKADIGNGGDLGDVRLAFAGLQSKNAGFLGIGQQWNTYYDIVAVPVDVLYNATNTPMGYSGPFRTSDFIKYNHSIGGLNIGAGVQVDGSDDTSAFTVGAGFDFGRGYIGVAYWNRDQEESVSVLAFDVGGNSTDTVPVSSVGQSLDGTYYNVTDGVPVDVVRTSSDADGEETHVGIAASFNINKDLYVAALYENISREDTLMRGGEGEDPSGLDVVAVYSFGDGFKLLSGISDYDTDNSDGDKVRGLTLGLAKNLAPGLDTYIDWLRLDDDRRDDASNQVNIGIRYNFDVGLL